ncbi:MAG: deoxyguanosinetriphosphate triphosphohydrolase [Clostridia bacterium]|nr:deoxyguanosinetriphosphate triphosphohydrolase [Clostridia bacterium]
MNVKERIDEYEKEYLSPFACHTADSKGRDREISPDFLRGEFQRDRDRIIHCKSFRRLMHKTQVFLSPEHDHYRTRLTHTLEVCQIGRTIARALRLNEDLIEASALGHDLGHTPFGHAGERVLRRCYDPDFAHYEQSIRVVEILEDLNLTWEVRDAIRHHTHGGASTLEGDVLLEADHIAFINHDIDDAIRAGIITQEELPREAIRHLGETHGERIDTMVRSIVENSEGRNKIVMDDTTREMTKMLYDFLFDRVYINSAAKTEESKAEAMLEQLFRYFEKYPETMPAEYTSRLDRDGVGRTVCDYIACMTDRYATNTFRRLFVPDSWRG